ncbi:MAG: hypothetical protein KBT27_13410 [Prevotellaceae bacterium]|nr:hypothetical protein [Candidatus Faecinaster equi]
MTYNGLIYYCANVVKNDCNVCKRKKYCKVFKKELKNTPYWYSVILEYMGTTIEVK